MLKIALMLFLAMAPAGTQATQARVAAVVGGTVIDGTGRAPLADATVVMRAGRIRAVGPRDRVPLPPDAEVIDARGKWIIPGLIDAHVHFFQSGGLYTRPDVIDLREVRPYAEERRGIAQRLPQTFARYLASGVTAVLDTGGPRWNFEVRQRAAETPLAPRVAVAGPLISTIANEVLALDDPPIIQTDTPQAARASAREQLARRPDFVKVWFIHRPGDDIAEQARLVEAVAAEAHAAGVRVIVHATELEVARAAVQAGADVLAHSVDDARVDEDFVRLLKERNVVYITTLMVQEGYREVLGQDVRLTDIERRLGDPAVIVTFDDLARLRPGAGWRMPASRRRIMGWNLRRLHEAGVTIAAGTDAGNIGTLHGPALHREMEMMAQAGLSPEAVLIAATRGGAQAMRRSADLGTIEPGKLADLVLLDADPLADITHTRQIHRVIKDGKVLDPDRLRAAMAVSMS